MTRTWVAAVAALAVACGSGRSTSSGQGTQSQDEGGGGASGGDGAGGGGKGGGGEVGGSCEGPATVRLEVANLGFFEALELDVAAVELAVTGGSVTFDPGVGGLLVLRKDDPGLLATLTLAKDEIVDATVSLNRIRACLPEHCLQLDPCTSPLRFRIDFWKVRDRCDVVVRIDLDRSVFADRESWAFLPRYSVHY